MLVADVLMPIGYCILQDQWFVYESTPISEPHEKGSQNIFYYIFFCLIFVFF